jgi:hypothetical protein
MLAAPISFPFAVIFSIGRDQNFMRAVIVGAVIVALSAYFVYRKTC